MKFYFLLISWIYGQEKKGFSIEIKFFYYYRISKHGIDYFINLLYVGVLQNDGYEIILCIWMGIVL